MLEARIVSRSVRRDARELYEMLWRPESFPLWASGLSGAGLEPDGDAWRAMGPDGPVMISFTGRNDHGVMDHVVRTADGGVVHVPMRIVPNGDGSEVTLILFRQPGMDDARIAADEAWVRRDLETLASLAEGA